MNKIVILLLVLFATIRSNSQQIFPTPSGEFGSLIDKTKELSYSFSQAWPPIYCQSAIITNLRKKKKSSKNRRFSFTANFSSNSWSQPELECGWNKLGRLSFKDSDKGGWNKYKLHVGWRSSNEQDKLLFSLYFHDQHDVNWVWNKFAEGYVNTDINVDMFLGTNVLALIVDNYCIGVRYKDYFPEETGESALARTFFFGGSCCPPTTFMTLDYSDQLYDYNDFQTNFNSKDYMTWNLSEFVQGDLDKFYANKLVNGSVGDPQNNVGSKVEIEEQKCVISSGADITFGSKEKVILYPGFHAKPGSHFVAAICNKIIITSTPEDYTSYQCYNALDVVSAKAKLFYKDWIAEDWIFISSVIGSIYGNQICFDFGNEGILPPIGQYKVEATFSNKCLDKKSVDIYDVFTENEKYLLDSLSKIKVNNNLKDIVIMGNSESLDIKPIKNITSNFLIYPNPNGGIFKIDYSGGFQMHYGIEVVDLMGNSIFIRQNISDISLEVNISEHPKGIYFLKIQQGDQVFTEKIIYR